MPPRARKRPASRARRAPRAAVAALACALALAACARDRGPAPVTARWVVGGAAPPFDPDGPPHAPRYALERWLSQGLVAEDSAGAVVPAAAASWSASRDSLTWTFRLAPGLAFTDGAPCTAEDFRRALAAGLGRTDHATSAWLLAPVTGLERVRAGLPLPPLGLEAPDPRTLVVRLARPAPDLPRRLAAPGVGVPWRDRAPAGGWRDAVGLGPYRVASHEPGRTLTLVPTAGRRPAGGPDTLEVRFAIGAPRVRALLRARRADLVWPLPPGLLDEALPAGAEVRRAAARPARHLVLALRADTPPTSRPAARAALAHALHRAAALRALGAVAEAPGEWPDGAGRFQAPVFDAAETRAWMERGRLGRSFHVELGYDADGAGAAVARTLQTEWARLGLDVGLVPLRGAAARQRALVGGPQLFLAECQPPLPGAAAELATLVMPLRGPGVGAVRTGWRTREFDPWIAPGPRPAGPRLDAAAARVRLEQERVAIPLARLPWVWVVAGEGAGALAAHPGFGPACIPHAGSDTRGLGR
jgi:ABC-type transport system substrate-binding protein